MKYLLPIIIFLSLFSCGAPPEKTIYIFEQNIDSIVWGVLPDYAYMGGLRERENNEVISDKDVDTRSVTFLRSNFINSHTFTGNEVKHITECFRFHLAEGSDEVEQDREKRLPPEYRDILIFYQRNKIEGWAKISFGTEDVRFKSFTRPYEEQMGAYTYRVGIDYISLRQILKSGQ